MPVRFVILTVLLMWGVLGRCAIVRVAPGSAYPTIAAGLARVHGGDTLLVGPGRYTEGELVVNKRLTILGQPGAILDGESKTGLLVLRAPAIHVSGLHFRNVGRSDLKELSAIRVENTVSATLENNTIKRLFSTWPTRHTARFGITGSMVRRVRNPVPATVSMFGNLTMFSLTIISLIAIGTGSILNL